MTLAALMNGGTAAHGTRLRNQAEQYRCHQNGQRNDSKHQRERHLDAETGGPLIVAYSNKADSVVSVARDDVGVSE